jgi:hypothetical protein
MWEQTFNWHYSHYDSDAGVKVTQTRKKMILNLLTKKMKVSREFKFLWRKHAFSSRIHKEKWGDRFYFTIEQNPIRGVYYKQFEGTAYWREWFEYLDIPGGGRQARFSNQDLLGVTINGQPIYRVENATATVTVRNELTRLYQPDLIAIEDIISKDHFES